VRTACLSFPTSLPKGEEECGDPGRPGLREQPTRNKRAGCSFFFTFYFSKNKTIKPSNVISFSSLDESCLALPAFGPSADVAPPPPSESLLPPEARALEPFDGLRKIPGLQPQRIADRFASFGAPLLTWQGRVPHDPRRVKGNPPPGSSQHVPKDGLGPPFPESGEGSQAAEFGPLSLAGEGFGGVSVVLSFFCPKPGCPTLGGESRAQRACPYPCHGLCEAQT